MPAGEESLGEGLVLRHVASEQDAVGFVALNAEVNGPAEGETCTLLLRHHPLMGAHDFLLVEDQRSGRVVSTTCLIPWQCRYEDVTLEVGMLEMVTAHPAYRRRGLIRAQIERWHRALEERGVDVCIVQGIPYYYRQFGYAYAIDNGGSDTLPARRVPPGSDGGRHDLHVRPATPGDAPTLARLYDQAVQGAELGFYALRSVEQWQYLLRWARLPARLVEDDRGPVGYVCAERLIASPGTRVLESGMVSREAALAVLQKLAGDGAGELQLAWPETGALVQTARGLGSRRLPAYQWLLRIPNVGRLLGKIAPVLEWRLAASALAGLTAGICLNLYREAFVLRFAAGRLAEVAPAGFVDASMGAPGGDINLPPEAFVRLLFGYRSAGELRDAWPDIVIRPERSGLVDALFPKMAGYLCVPHMYCGPA